MAVTININGLTLAHQGSDGVAIATLPDVCKTPSPPGPPVPLPYPNIARASSLANATTRVKVDGGNPAAVRGSELSLSNGDNAGVTGGVKSLTVMARATWLTYSFNVRIEGRNACRLTDKMLMNEGNTACLGGFMQAPLAIAPALRPHEQRHLTSAPGTDWIEIEVPRYLDGPGVRPLSTGASLRSHSVGLASGGDRIDTSVDSDDFVKVERLPNNKRWTIKARWFWR